MRLSASSPHRLISPLSRSRMDRSILYLLAWLLLLHPIIAQDPDTGSGENTTDNPSNQVLLLQDSVQFSYQLVTVPNVPSNNNEPNAIEVEMIYNGLGYISFGIAADNRGLMVDGEAIIALPDRPVSNTNPGKYSMSIRDTSGVLLMPDEQQTLIDPSIVQDADARTTTLKFTKLLNEEGELPISLEETNTFLVAASFNNFLGYHDAGRESFQVNLQSGETIESPSKGGTDPAKKAKMVAIHGIFMALGWMLITPVAVSASLLRNLLPCAGAAWLKIHHYLNAVTLLLTLTAFLLMVVVAFKDNPSHKPSENVHFMVGWFITLAVMAQVVSGLLRPARRVQVHHGSGKTVEDGQANGNGNSHQNGRNSDTTPPDENSLATSGVGASIATDLAIQGEGIRTRKRQLWEYGHKLLGTGLVAISWWQVYTGLKLYESRGGASFVKVYTGYLIALGIVVILLKGVSVRKKVKSLYMASDENAQHKEGQEVQGMS